MRHNKNPALNANSIGRVFLFDYVLFSPEKSPNFFLVIIIEIRFNAGNIFQRLINGRNHVAMNPYAVMHIWACLLYTSRCV